MKNISILMLIFLLPKVGFACSCAGVTVDDYLSQCENLFLARLVKAEYSVSGEYEGKIKGRFGKPIEVYQGDPKKVKGLKEVYLGTSCDQFPSVGVKYLVCGVKDERYTGYSHCSYTVGHAEYYRRDILKQLRGKTHNK